MNYIEPRCIRHGGTIGIIALSGVVNDRAAVARGLKKLEDAGFNVKISEHLYDKNKYLAGDDNVKLRELHAFFKDDKIDCILCVRGGYGAIRLVDRIDYNIIKNNPKAFCGYSDITAFSVMLLKHAGLITYSAPMLISDFGDEMMHPDTFEYFIKALAGDSLVFDISGNKTKSASGILWGGNLTTLASLCGRDFIPNDDFILAIEDINEPAYKIDRALEQLFGLSNFRTGIRGIVTGEFIGIDNQEWLDEILTDFALKCGIELWRGLKWGHGTKKITLPIGRKAMINNNKLKSVLFHSAY